MNSQFTTNNLQQTTDMLTVIKRAAAELAAAASEPGILSENVSDLGEQQGEIGKGATGKVGFFKYKSVIPVAVKVLLPQESYFKLRKLHITRGKPLPPCRDFKNFVANEKRNLEVIASAHKNKHMGSEYIAKYYGQYQLSNEVRFVFEYISGETLDKLISSTVFEQVVPKLAYEEVYRILWQLVLALACLHYNGIIHVDLKTENVLLTSSRDIKLLDFGLSLYLDPAKKNQPREAIPRRGNALYSSPEGLANHVVYTDRHDVYSAAIIISELLANERFDESLNYPEFEDFAERVICDDLRPALPADTPRKLSLLAKGMWAKKPEQRFSAHELAEEMATGLNEVSERLGMVK